MVRVEDVFAVDWWKGVLKGLLGGEGGWVAGKGCKYERFNKGLRK